MAFVFSCPRCEFTSRQEPRFVAHLLSTHSLESFDAYLEKFSLPQAPDCACGCGMSAPWKGWKDGFSNYLRGHNARVSTCFSDPRVIESMKVSRALSREAGVWSVWNAGLTKESCESLKAASEKKSKTLALKYASGEIIPWQRGHTKSTSPSVMCQSVTKIRKFNSGELRQWNAGLTSETSRSVATAAQKISESYRAREAGRRLSAIEVVQRVEGLGFRIDEDDYTSRKGWGLTVTHLQCGTQQVRSLYSLESGSCVKCDNMTSTGQREVEEFIRSLIPQIETSTRRVIPPQEIDIWVPSKNFGIEFNGLYWHSEKFLEKDYHEKKSRAVREAGGDLLHIFEDEWREKRHIVESMIVSRLGLTQKSRGARSCRLESLSNDERRRFFDSAHIDGDVQAAISWGLYDGETLVAALSLREPFHGKWREWFEVARFATLPGRSIPGALGKLTAAAISHARSLGKAGLMTYVDTRLGLGKSYRTVGFQEIESTSPRFWWTDFRRRLNRFSVRANRAGGKTEKEVAASHGVVKIWGCSNKVLVLEPPRQN